MTYSLVFAAEVYDDLQETVDWYNGIQARLGSRFFNAVKAQTVTIKKTLLCFAIRYDDVRCAKMDKFPFLIHYKVFTEIKVIKIIAVFSTDRNPDIWKGRNK